MTTDRPRPPLARAVARIEAQIAFATLLRHLPDLRLETGVLEWEPSLSFRELARLPVAFAAQDARPRAC